MVAFKLQKHFDTHWPGEDDYRPASFFPTGLVEPKCWYLKKGGVGWKHGGASLQVNHHNLNWHLHFPNNIGIVWEAGGNGEARVFFQLRMLPDIIQYLVYHCTLLQLLNTVLPPFFRNFKPSDIETTWFWTWKSWSTKTGDANSKHVLHLRATTSSQLGSFFCTPKQWPFLWSVGINSYHNNAHISKLSGF